MSLPAWCRDTVTRLRATKITDHGSSVDDWSTPERFDIERCSFQQAGGADNNTQRNADSGTALLLTPPGTDIVGTDRIEYAGEVWSIIGRPFHVKSPTGRLDHVVANLEIWEG